MQHLLTIFITLLILFFIKGVILGKHLLPGHSYWNLETTLYHLSLVLTVPPLPCYISEMGSVGYRPLLKRRITKRQSNGWNKWMKRTFMFLIYFSLKVFVVENVHSAYGTSDPEVGQGIFHFTLLKCSIIVSHPLHLPPTPNKSTGKLIKNPARKQWGYRRRSYKNINALRHLWDMDYLHVSFSSIIMA